MASDEALQMLQEYQRLDRKRRAADVELTDDEEKRWNELREQLEAALGTGGAEEAASAGVLRVRYRRSETFADNYLDNLSGGGVFIKTKNPLPLNTTFTVHFVFDDKSYEFDVNVRVVWENTVEPQKGSGPAMGMGVKFLDVDKEDQQFINDILTAYL